jgi:serine/threonine protein kinase
MSVLCATAQDYSRSLLEPQNCFSDSLLRQGAVECDMRGSPRSLTGNFASVFRVSTPGGTFAVKCFLRMMDDQAARYKEIQKHFARNSTENTVTFEFLEKGIQVSGHWFPIVKMEWVDGDPLDTFILKNSHESRFYGWLLQQFTDLQARLSKAQIAHGDLNHANIYVTKHGLKLIDYDCAYVPSLAGCNSNELGHHNYQHPKRARSDFGAHLDNFAAWVIQTSLQALSIDSSLAEKLALGDECLLFRSSDFCDPISSYAFSVLEQHSSEEISYAARKLRQLCDMQPAEIPPAGAPLSQQTRLPPLRTAISLPRWIPRQPEVALGDVQVYPGFRDYNEALRFPAMAFVDPELQTGVCIMEDTRCGAQGRVYHLICEQRDVAVKCFLSDEPDREARYNEISKALTGDLGPYVVSCQYVREGVVVRGRTYPILKMDWFAGTPVMELPFYQMTDAVASYIADQFVQFVAALRKCGLGHGDLEPGNIMIDLRSHDVKFIDYDNMFVPALTRLGSMELGHAGFQSPRRTKADYGPYVDNFSAWLVHYILKHLPINRQLPELLEQCFQEERTGSTAHVGIRALETARETEVRNLGAMVRALLARPLHMIPAFSADDTLLEAISKQTKEVTAPGGLLKRRPPGSNSIR